MPTGYLVNLITDSNKYQDETCSDFNNILIFKKNLRKSCLKSCKDPKSSFPNDSTILVLGDRWL